VRLDLAVEVVLSGETDFAVETDLDGKVVLTVGIDLIRVGSIIGVD